MKIYDMILFAIAYILFVSSRVRAERLSMSGVASVWKRNGGSSSACPTAVAVAWAESRGDTRARGQNSNSYDRGLWQINSYWHRDVSDSCAYDKNCNAKNAVRISSNGRKWSPWATYNDGLHRRWMNDAKKACGGSYDILGENLVGGGKVYGEYNKGPVKAGGEYNWDELHSEMCCQSMSPACVACRQRQQRNENIGGGRVYGEYNKGPYKAGAEYNWDENYGPNLGDGGGYNPAPHLGDGANLGGGGGYNPAPHLGDGANLGGGGRYNPAPHLDVSSPRWDVSSRDEAEENVGGGRVYGEYNKGPYKAGAEYNWDEDTNVGGPRNYPPIPPPFLDEAEENVGGGRVYGEYNKGPYKAGAEYNWDEQVGQPHGYTPGEWEALDMQATLQGFKKFDHKWHQFTTHQSIEKFTTPGNFVRRLKAIQKKTNLRKGRSLNFLGAFDALTSSVSGATGAVQGILNLFGKKSSESLVGQFQDRGFSHFNERTTITVTSGLPTKYFTAFMKDMLKSVVKVPSKHKDAVKQIVRWGLYTGANTWNAAENVFDIGKGGNVKNFQIFLNRNTACEEMNIVLVKTDVAFKLAPDIFVISKSKSSWGGAFSSTKLHWKKSKAPIKQADLTFVSEYFITLGMNCIKQSREIGGMANAEDGGCGGNAPPPQESPFRL